MLSYQPELEALPLDAATKARLLAVERRELFSIHGELRALIWAGVMMIVGAVGIILSHHIDEIGPIAIAAVIAVVASACYAFAWWKKKKGDESLADDYVLLLASLLVSADVGYLEHQFHLLDGAWARHFLLLAIFHGAMAYLFESRIVLGVSISALAAYLGLDRSLGALFNAQRELAIRTFACAAILAIWREVDRRRRPQTTFDETLAHFAANLAFWGGLILIFRSDHLVGAAIVLGLALAAARYGFRTNREAFVMYAYVYAVIAVEDLVVTALGDDALGLMFVLVSTIAAIVGLFLTHAQFKRKAAAI